MKLFDLNKHRDTACNLVLPPPFRPVALVCSSPLLFLPSLVSPRYYLSISLLSSLLSPFAILSVLALTVVSLPTIRHFVYPKLASL